MLIIAFELGGSGNNYNSLYPDHSIVQNEAANSRTQILRAPSVNNVAVQVTQKPVLGPLDNKRCPHNDGNGQICSHLPGI